MRKMCNTPAKIEEFHRRYEIPDTVDVALVAVDDASQASWDVMHILVIFVVDGGVRFPLHPLLRETLAYYRLSPMQVSPNIIRVIMGVAKLNRLSHPDFSRPRTRSACWVWKIS